MVQHARHGILTGLAEGAAECRFVTGRGAHRADGVAKIRDAVVAYLWTCEGVSEQWLENGGGMVVARLE